jgi:hypothetical protein
LGNNGPDQGQTLAAADRWRTDGTERELAMLIEVRGGRSRYFSVPQSPIYCSLSSPPLLCLEAPSPPPRPPPRAMPFDPACRASQLTLCAPVRVRVVFADGAQVQGRGRAARARSWWASFRGHRHRDDGRQDADGGDAEQHHLDIYRGGADGYLSELSGRV